AGPAGSRLTRPNVGQLPSDRVLHLHIGRKRAPAPAHPHCPWAAFGQATMASIMAQGPAVASGYAPGYATRPANRGLLSENSRLKSNAPVTSQVPAPGRSPAQAWRGA